MWLLSFTLETFKCHVKRFLEILAALLAVSSLNWDHFLSYNVSEMTRQAVNISVISKLVSERLAIGDKAGAQRIFEIALKFFATLDYY